MDDIKPMRVLVACEESQEVCKDTMFTVYPRSKSMRLI